MSWFTNTNASSRRCSRFSSELVSRLSTQMTRKSFASRYSQRWEPRNPAPPVTTAVGIRKMVSAVSAGSRRFRRALRTSNAVRGEEGEHGLRERLDPLALEAVEDVVAVAPRLHEAGAGEQAQVLGQAGLADPHERRELLGRALAGGDQTQR